MRFKVAYAPVSRAVSDQGKLEGEDRLTAGEREALAKFRNPGRRASFVAGRMAAKQALSEFTQELEVLAGPSGEPLASAPGWGVSISHSGDLAVAVAFERSQGIKLGIDLEKIRPLEPGIAEQFCSQAEVFDLARLAPEARSLKLLRLWTAKEAVYKAAFPGGASDPHTIEVVQHGEEWQSPGYRVLLSEVEGYISALALPL